MTPPNIAAMRRAGGYAGGDGVSWSNEGIIREFDAIAARYQYYFEAYDGIVSALGTVPRDPVAASHAVAVLRERVAELEAQVHWLTPAPTLRTPRPYKGVTYHAQRGAAAAHFLYEGLCWPSAASLIAESALLTDDDHAALLLLRAEPFMSAADVHNAVFTVVRAALEETWQGAHQGCGQSWRGMEIVASDATVDITALFVPAVP